MESDALISPCGQYRYWLSRHWDIGAYRLPIIMLNPSTADASVDDPTIRRCMVFARREGFGGICVRNLYAYRATSPKAMLAADDPVGPDNWGHLVEALEAAKAANLPVLCAWGTNALRGMYLTFIEAAQGHGNRLVCLGTTKDGHPRHPLYVKGDQPFENYP